MRGDVDCEVENCAMWEERFDFGFGVEEGGASASEEDYFGSAGFGKGVGDGDTEPAAPAGDENSFVGG